MPGGLALLNAPQQNLHTAPGHGADALPHRGELGHQIVADGQAVQSHNGHVLRHPFSGLLQSADGADGHYVRTGKQGGKFPARCQQVLGRPVAVLIGIADALIVPVRIKGDSMVGKGRNATLKPQAAGVGYLPVAADNGNLPVAQRNQHFHGAASRLPVVGGDAGQVLKGKH